MSDSGHIQTVGILLKARMHGETSSILHFLTENHGVIAGYMRGGRLLKNAASIWTGALCEVERRARLPEQLGNVQSELIRLPEIAVTSSSEIFALFHGICDLIAEILPPYAPEPEIYRLLLLLTQHHEKTKFSLAAICFLAKMLKIVGYAPDWKRCAVTDRQDAPLSYVSPKTGAAVCAEVGEPYKEKLFLLPAFLLAEGEVENVSEADRKNALRLLLYYYEKFLFRPSSKFLPPLLRGFIKNTVYDII